MKTQLREEDAAALDLLLDRSRAAGNGPRYAPATPGQERVRLAEQVLGLLQMLPEAEPPHDLVDRTLRFVEQVQHSTNPAELRGVTLPIPAPHPNA